MRNVGFQGNSRLRLCTNLRDRSENIRKYYAIYSNHHHYHKMLHHYNHSIWLAKIDSPINSQKQLFIWNKVCENGSSGRQPLKI